MEPRADGGLGGEDRVPWLQRFYDSPFWLLVAGIVVMILFYTGWGLLEVIRLPPAPLP